MSRRITVVLLAALAALGLGACGSERFDEADAVRRLTAAGLSEPGAECVVEGVVDRLGIHVLDGTGDVTQRQRRVLDAVYEGCVGRR